MIRLGGGMHVAGPLHRIIVEGRDLLHAHAIAREPARDMNVAQALHIGEDLAGAGSGGRARCRERIADQHDARPQVLTSNVQVRWPDLDGARHRKAADELSQAWHEGEQGLLGRLAEDPQPGIVHLAVDREIGAHRRANGEERDERRPVGGPFGIVRQGREVETVPPDRHEIEAEHDRMAFAQFHSGHAQTMAQAAVQPVRHDDQTRGNFLAIGERDGLPVRAVGYAGDLGANERDARRDFGADRIDERVVEDAVLIAGPLVHQTTETRDPRFAVMRGGAEYGVGESRLA